MSGASGPIGRALLSSFESQTMQVVRLVRGPARNAAQLSWDPIYPLPHSVVSGFDAVIHLAGESVVGRWTAEKKSNIYESRVQGTRNLATALAHSEAKPRVFICASAIGFYGNRGDEILDKARETRSGQARSCKAPAGCGAGRGCGPIRGGSRCQARSAGAHRARLRR